MEASTKTFFHPLLGILCACGQFQQPDAVTGFPWAVCFGAGPQVARGGERWRSERYRRGKKGTGGNVSPFKNLTSDLERHLKFLLL